jgi:hypothetical protein
MVQHFVDIRTKIDTYLVSKYTKTGLDNIGILQRGNRELCEGSLKNIIQFNRETLWIYNISSSANGSTKPSRNKIKTSIIAITIAEMPKFNDLLL